MTPESVKKKSPPPTLVTVALVRLRDGTEFRFEAGNIGIDNRNTNVLTIWAAGAHKGPLAYFNVEEVACVLRDDRAKVTKPLPADEEREVSSGSME